MDIRWIGIYHGTFNYLFTIDAHRHSYIRLVSKLSVMYGLTLFIHIKIIIELLIISPLESNIIPNEH